MGFRTQNFEFLLNSLYYIYNILYIIRAYLEALKDMINSLSMILLESLISDVLRIVLLIIIGSTRITLIHNSQLRVFVGFT